MRLGNIKLANFQALNSMPQKAATAWSSVEKLLGVNFKPLIYVGEQIVDGTNYYFIAEETFITLDGYRRLILLAINERDGEFAFVPESVESVVD